MKPNELLITELPEMNALVFDGYSPDPEIKAFGRMKDWINSVRSEKSYRIFGYNIDSKGNLTYDPQNAGYRVLLVIENYNAGAELQKEIIKPGKFLVVRTEGDIKDVGQWLPAGWTTLNKLIQEENLKVKNPPRWYEEHIKTLKTNYMIVDLHLELE
jgi:hypothetical protein